MEAGGPGVWSTRPSRRYEVGRFILQVVGSTSEAASDMATVFQPSPVFSESYFTSRVNLAT